MRTEVSIAAVNPRAIWSHPVHFLSLGFGSGLVPAAPGTFGTLVAVPLYLLLASVPASLYIGLLIFSFVTGIWLCGRTARALGVHDHPAIVWDEVVGYLATMLVAPQGWLWVTSGFFLFRFFDILKPWPIQMIDRRVTGGFGIMLDDLLAALYAWLILQILALSLR